MGVTKPSINFLSESGGTKKIKLISINMIIMTLTFNSNCYNNHYIIMLSTLKSEMYNQVL